VVFEIKMAFKFCFFVAGTEVAAPAFRLTLEGHLGKAKKF
jgi:hypothetical protein